jgi:hypothetical protein
MNTIVKVKFTNALTDGLWIERQSGSVDWICDSQVIREVGSDRAARLMGSAARMAGHWISA